jgi:hypothetical protein
VIDEQMPTYKYVEEIRDCEYCGLKRNVPCRHIATTRRAMWVCTPCRVFLRGGFRYAKEWVPTKREEKEATS